MLREKLKNRSSQAWMALAVAAALSLAFVSVATAVVYVYGNKFASGADYREIDQAGGGGRDCDASYRRESQSMRVEVSGETLCEYSPPVIGDSGQPDHEIVVEGRILERTPKNVRKQAYLAARVRVGEGDFYELRVTPKGRKFRLSRSPEAAAGLPLSGESNAIKPFGARNTLRLRVKGNDVTAFVNGDSVASFTDPNASQVEGRRVSFGVGSTKDVSNGPIGVFKQVRVGVPNP